MPDSFFDTRVFLYAEKNSEKSVFMETSLLEENDLLVSDSELDGLRYSWHVYMAWVLTHWSVVSRDGYPFLVRDDWYPALKSTPKPRVMLPSDSLADALFF